MTRRNQPIAGQNQLFTTAPSGRENQSAGIKTWQDMEASPEGRLEMLAGGNLGPHSNVVERAEKLIVLLNTIAHRNMLDGFDYATSSRRYKKPIWERYLDGTPRVIDHSKSKAERLDEEVTYQLVALSGFAKIKGTGLLTRGEVRAKIEKNDRDFEHLYGPTVKTSKARNSYRNALKQMLPEDHRLLQKKQTGTEKEAA